MNKTININDNKRLVLFSLNCFTIFSSHNNGNLD